MDLEKVEKMLNVKVTSVEEIKGKVFPLFDLTEVQGVKLALIKDPMFVVIDSEEIHEKKIEGSYIVVDDGDGRYLILKYVGEPNIDVLRPFLQPAGRYTENADAKPTSEASEHEDEVEVGREEDGKEQESGEDAADEVVRKILENLPKWADGAVAIREGDNVTVYPVKKSTKKDGAYYAATSWRPLDVRGTADLANCVIMRNGKTIRANVYVNDKYINVFTKRSTSPRKSYRR